MTAAERHATKLRIDQATRAKIEARGGEGARFHRRAQHVEAVKTVFFPTKGDRPIS